VAGYKKDINLLDAMAQKTARVSPLAVAVPVVVFLVLGVFIALGVTWYTSTTTLLSAERTSLQQYLESARLNEAQNKAEELKAQAIEMQGLAGMVKDTLYSLSSYPDLYEEHFDFIFELAGDNIELADYRYDRRTGVLSFSATSPSVRHIPYFVQGLRESNYFSDIQYQGYVKGVRTEDGEPVINATTDVTTIPTIEVTEYRYEITCKLTGPAPALPPLETDEVQEGGEG
jgi:hypothetical protein